jgi:hypothetical protein
MRSEEILKKTDEGMKEGNKILIQELVRDLEEKGISPVIAIDGEVKNLNLKLISKNEIEDFETELKKFGMQKSDFCLLEEDKTQSKSSQSYSICGNIFVIQKKSGKVKQYKNSQWVCDFHRDLQEKFFTS